MDFHLITLDAVIRTLALLAIIVVAGLSIHLAADGKISRLLATAFLISGMSGTVWEMARWHDGLPMQWYGAPLILAANIFANFTLWKLRRA